MLRTLFTNIVVFSCFTFLMAQNATIENVDFEVNGDKVVVTYNIANAAAEELFEINLKFVTKNDQTIAPKSTTGDIGKDIPGGSGKSITWKVMDDRSELEEELKAVVQVVSIRNTKYDHLGGGPGNAFRSLLIPGLGDYYVKKDATKKRPYWLFAATTTSLFIYSAIASGTALIHESTAQSYMDDYTSDPIYYSDYYTQAKYYDNLASKWRRKSGRALGFAFTIYAVDFTWCIAKGIRNNSIRKKYNIADNKFLQGDAYLGFDPIAEGPVVKYVLKF